VGRRGLASSSVRDAEVTLTQSSFLQAGALRRHALPLAALLALGLLGVAPLFHAGFPATHDGQHQIVRLMHFHRGLVDGQLPVRWAGTALCGYGYPLFVFTYRLPFWIAEPWFLLTRSLADAIKASFVVGFLASGVAMYWFAHLLTGSRLAAFAAAVLYLWAPYRFLDLYVRGALGEATAFVFVPLVYGSVHRTAHDRERRTWWSLALGVTAACLVLSHMMIAALFVVPVAAWWALGLWTTSERRAYVAASIRAGVVTLLLTAYYWLPASLERRYTLIAARLGNSWADHFVEPMQLVRGSWGFGFDLPGSANDGMSFQLGLAQWLVCGGAVMLLGVLAWQRVAGRGRSAWGPLPTFTVLVGTSLASLYGTLPASAWFYALLQHAVVIDLPWKCLSVTVFCAAALLAVAVDRLRGQPALRYGVVAVVLGLALYGNRDHVGVAAREYIPDAEWWRSNSTSNDYDEYAPSTFVTNGCSRDDPDLVVASGDAESRLLARRSNALSFATTVRSDDAVMQAKVASYPGWRASVDGQPATLADRGGRVAVAVPRGDHVVSLVWRETGWRLVGDWASLLGLVYVGATAVSAARRSRP